MEENKEKKTLWDFYNKCISEDNGKRAQCVICKNVYSYMSTIHNLKTHLFNIHRDVIGDLDLGVKPKSNVKNRKSLLDFPLKGFSIYGEEKIATCNYCKKQIPYSKTANLKTHLRQLHPTAFEKLFAGEDDETTTEDDTSIIYDDESGDETKSSEVHSYFERETGGRARCLLCQASLLPNEEKLRRHLKKHSELFNEKQDSDVLLQNDDDDQQEVFTEVVYLDETNIKPATKSEKSQWQDVTPRKLQARENAFKSTKKKRRVSSSLEEEPILKKNNDTELRKFGDYVMCLLEKLPPDVCMKMQMNIINMIMSANLNNSVNSIVESVPVVPGTVPVTLQSVIPQYYVLEKNSSNKSPLLSKSTGTVPVADNISGNHSFSISIAPDTVAGVPDDKCCLDNLKN